jgi:hypothetical protein
MFHEDGCCMEKAINKTQDSLLKYNILAKTQKFVINKIICELRNCDDSRVECIEECFVHIFVFQMGDSNEILENKTLTLKSQVNHRKN